MAANRNISLKSAWGATRTLISLDFRVVHHLRIARLPYVKLTCIIGWKRFGVPKSVSCLLTSSLKLNSSNIKFSNIGYLVISV